MHASARERAHAHLYVVFSSSAASTGGGGEGNRILLLLFAVSRPALWNAVGSVVDRQETKHVETCTSLMGTDNWSVVRHTRQRLFQGHRHRYSLSCPTEK